MSKSQAREVTMRVRVGDSEVEVTGPQEFVEKKVAEFLARANPSHEVSGKSLGGEKHEPPSTGKKLAVGQFFKKTSPKSEAQLVLAAGYFLEKYQGAASFTSVDVREAIRSAKRNPPKNPSDAIGKNIKKGLIMSAGDKDGIMAYVLTSDGEEEIETLGSQE